LLILKSQFSMIILLEVKLFQTPILLFYATFVSSVIILKLSIVFTIYHQVKHLNQYFQY